MWSCVLLLPCSHTLLPAHGFPLPSCLTTARATSALDMANRHQYWRLLVSPFLGAGVLHVWTNITTLTTFAVFLANDLPLWQIGETFSGP